VPVDVTLPHQRERVVREPVAAYGGLHLLIKNERIQSLGHFATSTEEINRQILEVNFFGPAELTRAAVPHLMQGRLPAVVNITSMCGRRGMPAWPEYSASKAALVGLSEALRGEFARFGIDVITIVPGLTKTDLNSHLLRSEGRANLPFDQGMEPAAVADAVVRAIRQNRREVVLGTEARRILRMNRFLPRLLNRLIANRVTKLYEPG
jgi:short-subunit dehydrogenase